MNESLKLTSETHHRYLDADHQRHTGGGGIKRLPEFYKQNPEPAVYSSIDQHGAEGCWNIQIIKHKNSIN